VTHSIQNGILQSLQDSLGEAIILGCHLIDPIARKLLAGDLLDGAVIQVTADQEGLEIGRATLTACRSNPTDRES
jgi:hypothetical protein